MQCTLKLVYLDLIGNWHVSAPHISRTEAHAKRKISHHGKLGIINAPVSSIIRFLDAQPMFKYLRKRETS